MNEQAAQTHLFHDVSRLLNPRSIAIIGASDQPGAISGVCIKLLQKFAFPGDIWPVNPNRTEVHGLKCHANVAALPGTADIAIIATAAAHTPALVRECAAAGIRTGIIWSGGFSEVGPDGAALQARLAEACAETGFALQGPNCLGVINTALPAMATFASFLLETDKLIEGSISIVSQSGGTATMAQALAQQAGFGFRYTISTGNEAILSAADFIYALAHDSGTRVVAAYLEGVRNGDKFVAALRACREAGKPVVVLKGGATAASARAALAHTGALVGESRVWDAVFHDEAVIQVHSLEQLIDTTCYLSSIDLKTLPQGPGLVSVAFGGGGGVLSADQCARHGLKTPRLTDDTIARLRPLVPPIAAVENPIDVTPQAFNSAAYFATFGEALDVIAADPGIDIVLLQFGPMAQRGLEIADLICEFRHRTRKTVCIAWPLAPSGVPERLRERGVCNFLEYERAIATLGRLRRHVDDARQPTRAKVASQPFDWSAAAGTVRAGTVIPEHDCHRILRSAGLAVAAGQLVTSAKDAAAAAARVGLPVAMKGISAGVTHRAAAGLVRLGIGSAVDASATYEDLARTAERSGIALDGVYMQRMIGDGLEILISVFRDPVFGLMISVGAGGALTELIDDVVVARAPIAEGDLVVLLERLRLVRSALKSRNAPDIAALARYAADVSRLAASAPWRQFVLEINPVKWSAAGVVAVDGLLIVEAP